MSVKVKASDTVLPASLPPNSSEKERLSVRRSVRARLASEESERERESTNSRRMLFAIGSEKVRESDSVFPNKRS